MDNNNEPYNLTDSSDSDWYTARERAARRLKLKQDKWWYDNATLHNELMQFKRQYLQPRLEATPETMNASQMSVDLMLRMQFLRTMDLQAIRKFLGIESRR